LGRFAVLVTEYGINWSRAPICSSWDFSDITPQRRQFLACCLGLSHACIGSLGRFLKTLLPLRVTAAYRRSQECCELSVLMSTPSRRSMEPHCRRKCSARSAITSSSIYPQVHLLRVSIDHTIITRSSNIRLYSFPLCPNQLLR
jgi:hypothetical protein